MEHWQQFAFRIDPYESIPFATEIGLSVDAKIGLLCLAAVALCALFGW